MQNVTIKTVAEKSGVSIKTVSRVINNEPSVRSSTREKVLAVIAELGYEPSPAAQALASNRSKIIGLIYHNPSAAYVLGVQTGVLNTCHAEDYNLVIHPCDHSSAELTEDLLSLVQKSRLDGLILTPPICDIQDTVQALIEQGVHVVSISPAIMRDEVSSVACNDAVIVESIIQKLIDKDHKDIGFVIGHKKHGAAYQRYVGYQNALQKSGISEQESLVIQGDFSYESGVNAGRSLLGLENRPTAVFASNDYMAAGVMTVAHEKDIKVPEELEIIGFDDAPVASQIWPLLTTVKQPVQKMAELVTKQLIEQIKDSKAKVVHQTLVAELIARNSAEI